MVRHLMRVLIVSPYFFPAKPYGGPIASAGALCRALAAREIELRVLTSDADGPRRIRTEQSWTEVWPRVPVHYSKRFLFELWAPGHAWQVVRWLWWADVVYVWGAWFWALPLLCWLGRIVRRPVIVSPRGMLFDEALAGKALKKRLFLGSIARSGFQIHATSDEETTAVGRRWPAARIATIPNGVDVPDATEWPKPSAAHDARRYLLYLGRLHPYKQVDGIIKAFAAETSVAARTLAAVEPSDLWLAGDGDATYVASLRKLAADSGVGERVRFLGPVDGPEKSSLLAHAKAVVLASKSENFGMSVAEALAHGTPCIVTKTAPWAGLEREGCGFWVDDSVDALADGMRRLLALPEAERRAMGERGRAWMIRDFSWDSVADKMIELFHQAIAAKG